MKKFPRLAYLLLLLAATPLAMAHPGHGPMDFTTGLVHPLTGWDHLLAMVAIGLWAALLGGRARWALPTAFVSAMALGAAAGIAGLRLESVDLWVFATVFILGLLLAGAVRMPLKAGLVLAASAGALHGLAHGMEMPLQANSVLFLGGMVISTAALHALGLAAGLAAQKRHASLLRWAGVGILAGGLAFCLA